MATTTQCKKLMGENKKTEYFNHPLLQKDKVIKRKYQMNIFISAVKTNSLVVIPTGLGKTIVAVLLALHRLRSEKEKIIFLAPTRPLVVQHLRTFQNLTNLGEEDLVMATGNLVPKKRQELYEDARCLFLTPQILENDIIANRIHLKDVSLIIFDEAHRGVGKYAYTFIAKKYMEQSIDPKILALTASPGKNKEKIEEVMQNLHLDHVEVRTDEDSDVKPYIQEVKTIWKDVELPEEMHEIIALLNRAIEEISAALEENGILDPEGKKSSYKKSGVKKSITRTQLLEAGTYLDTLIANAQRVNDADSLPMLFSMKKNIANGMRVSHMLELVEVQSIEALQEYVIKNEAKVAKGEGGKSLWELFNSPFMDQIRSNLAKLKENQISHPKIAVLMDIVMKNFAQNEDSRMLIFCHFRDTVRILVDELNKSIEVSAHQFIGQGKKSREKGMTQKEQLAVLEQFKEGGFNTLIATSVAEEGLDIAECDVVVFYDVVPSAIRTIQRRGRTGRNSSGKVYILKTAGTREEGYFWAARSREKKMKVILKELREDFVKKNQKKKGNGMSLNKFITPEKEGKKEKKQEVGSIPESTPSIEKLRIMVDSREMASTVVRSLSERDIELDLQTLPVADYIISERCGIERKAIQDFVDSIKDGRLFDELKRLTNQFSFPILILEGGINNITAINRNAVLGTLTSIMLKMNVYLYQTQSEEETAEIVVALAKKEHQENRNKPYNVRFKKIPEDKQKQLEYIISGIPGINTTRAQDLMENFDTLRALFNADVKELEGVDKVGKKTAKKIFDYANLKYNKV